MSQEIHALFAGGIPDLRDVQRAIDELSLPFKIKAKGALQQLSGYLPVTMGREATGTEVYCADGSALNDTVQRPGSVPEFDHCVSFRWGGDEVEALVSMGLSAALAYLRQGIVYEEAEGEFITADEAILRLRVAISDYTKRSAAEPPAFDQAALKRLLKPLLALRPDLALRGRRLFIVPVRHLVRGVLFDRTGSKNELRLWWFVKPLYIPGEGTIGWGECINDGLWRTDTSYFRDVLLKVLGETLLEPLGRIQSLDELVAAMDGDSAGLPQNRGGRIFGRPETLLLAGHVDLARAALEEPYYHEKRELLALAPDNLCARYRAAEAQSAKELKLGSHWQPAPFPIELPVEDRNNVHREAGFPLSPWLSGAAGWSQSVPDKPGASVFALNKLWSCFTESYGRPELLLSPLNDEAARKLHDAFGDYVLVKCIADGQIAVLRHRRISKCGREPDDHTDTYPEYTQSREYTLDLFGDHQSRLQASFCEQTGPSTDQKLNSVTIFAGNANGTGWRTYIDKDWQQMIWSQSPYAKAEVPVSRRGIFMVVNPQFGFIDAFIAGAIRVLQQAGGPTWPV